jgi:hypothetical protein
MWLLYNIQNVNMFILMYLQQEAEPLFETLHISDVRRMKLSPIGLFSIMRYEYHWFDVHICIMNTLPGLPKNGLQCFDIRNGFLVRFYGHREATENLSNESNECCLYGVLIYKHQSINVTWSMISCVWPTFIKDILIFFTIPNWIKDSKYCNKIWFLFSPPQLSNWMNTTYMYDMKFVWYRWTRTCR